MALLRRSIERADADARATRPIWISPTDEHLRRLAAIIGTNRVSRLLQFFQTRVLRATEAGLRIADLSDQIEVAVALEAVRRVLRAAVRGALRVQPRAGDDPRAEPARARGLGRAARARRDRRRRAS